MAGQVRAHCSETFEEKIFDGSDRPGVGPQPRSQRQLMRATFSVFISSHHSSVCFSKLMTFKQLQKRKGVFKYQAVFSVEKTGKELGLR